MEDRRIRGEGLTHEQDYIEERLEDAGDVTDYGQAADKLEQEAKDLQRLTQHDATPSSNTPHSST